MKEERIISFVGIHACIIMAKLSDANTIGWLWIATSVYWLVRYFYITIKNKNK